MNTCVPGDNCAPAVRCAPEGLCYAVQNLDRRLKLATEVRVAGTSGARRRGLLGIETLAAGAGLWIAPCEAIHTFGMKVAIDVVFLDKDFRVRKLVPKLAPRRIAICWRASSVLELQADAVVRSGTKIGDRFKFEPVSPAYASEQTQPMSSSSTCLPS